MILGFSLVQISWSTTNTQTMRRIRSSYNDACGFRENQPDKSKDANAALLYIKRLKTCRTYLENETKSIENDIIQWTQIHHEWSMVETERTLNVTLSESGTRTNMWIKRLNNTLNGQLSPTYYVSQLIITSLFSLVIAFMISKYLGSEISRRAIFSWASKTLSPRGGRRSRKQILTELPKNFRGTWHHDCDESLQSLLKLVGLVKKNHTHSHRIVNM